MRGHEVIDVRNRHGKDLSGARIAANPKTRLGLENFPTKTFKIATHLEPPHARRILGLGTHWADEDDSDGCCQEIAVMWANHRAAGGASEHAKREANFVDVTASNGMYSLAIDETCEESIVPLNDSDFHRRSECFESIWPISHAQE